MTKLRTLVIDDHKVTCKGYQFFFENAYSEGLLPNFEIEFSHDSESAFKKITGHYKSGKKYDIIFLDIQLPPYPEGKIYSGEDLGILIRRYHPKTKIIVQTLLSDNHVLHNIFKKLNPEGIVLKVDLDENSFIVCVNNILKNIPYYSSTFSRLLRNQFSKGYIIDEEDRELLYLLNRGIASKDVAKHLHWSRSKVEKRKRVLRAKFEVEDKNVLSLINAAKELGFL